MIKKLHWYHWIFSLTFAISLMLMAMLLSQSVRLDESQTMWAASKSLPSVIELTARDVHVPLYNLMSHVVTTIFGLNITVLRLQSFVFFLLSLPFLYALFRTVSDPALAWLSMILFVASPFVIWYSMEARMYTLFVFVTTLCHLFFTRYLQEHGKKYRLLLWFSLVIGIYTHYFFWLIIGVQGLYLIWRYQHFTPQLRKKAWKLLLNYSLIVSTAAVTILPWLVYVASLGSASDTKPLIPLPSSYNIFQLYTQLVFGFQSDFLQENLISLWPLLVLFVFFFFTRKRNEKLLHSEYFIMATFIPVLVTFVASFLIRPIFLSRYLILIVPSFSIFIAWIVLNSSQLKSGIIGSLLAIFLLGNAFYQVVSSNTPVKENYSLAVEYLSQRATPQDIIAVSSPFTLYPIEYLYAGQAKIETIPYWDRYAFGSIPPFTEDLLSEQMKRYTQQYKKMYLVLSYDQGYHEKIRQFLDHNYELIKKEDYSDGLEVREYQLRYETLPAVENSSTSASTTTSNE